MSAILLAGLAVVAVIASSKRGGGSGYAGSSGPSGAPSKKSSVQRVSKDAVLLNPEAAFRALNLPPEEWAKPVSGIPFAAGDPSPVWPIITKNKSSMKISYRSMGAGVVGNGARRFLASRNMVKGKQRYHVGMDLYGNSGDPLLATESGTVVNIYYFYNGAYALFLRGNSGLTINYGEIKKNSWKEFGIDVGSKVKKGAPLARIGTMSGGSFMLHFETYMPPTKKNKRFFGGGSGPILNPTYYLILARRRAKR